LAPDDVLPVLSSFMELKNIPKEYGGELDWTFFDEPNFEDPELKRIMQWENGHTSLPAGPHFWRPYGDGSRLELVAVGSKGGVNREERVMTIPVAFPKGEKKPETTEAAAAVAATNPLPVNGETPKTAEVNVDATADQLQKTNLNAGETAPVSEKTATETAPPKETVTAQ
jgi:hypothetical protein